MEHPSFLGFAKVFLHRLIFFGGNDIIGFPNFPRRFCYFMSHFGENGVIDSNRMGERGRYAFF